MTTGRVLLVCWAAVTLLPRLARADLGTDVQRLLSLWRPHYAVERLPPRLMERGELLPILVPPSSMNRSTRDCTTLVAMGVTSAELILHFVSSGARAAHFTWPKPSSAGIVEITRCGTRKAMLRNTFVEMRSPRGVVEFFVLRSPTPLPSVHRYLKHRDPGPIVGRTAPVTAPPPLALDEHIRLIEEGNRLAGGLEQERQWAASRADGTGQLTLHLMPGCHRLDFLAPRASPADRSSSASSGERPFEPSQPDIDVDLRWALHDSRVLLDHRDHPDGLLEFCLAAPDLAQVHFVGAPPEARVAVLRTTWPLPLGLPVHWGDRARARMAEAIRSEHPGNLKAPVYESLGVGGQTTLPVELLPDRCYLAAVTALEGGASGVSLSAVAGGPERQNQSRAVDRGTALAFCAHGAETGVLRVQTRGSLTLWLLAVWPIDETDSAVPPD